jgi:hypothetical protein
MDYLDNILQIIDSYKHLGERVLSNGTRLVGRAPHIAPEAWLHEVYRPLSDQEVCRVETELGRTMPPEFSSFLQRCNGLGLFSGSLSIYGLRSSYERTGDAVWQPFDISTPNVDERPRGSKTSFLFVGGYSDDGSQLYIDGADLKVYRCKQRTTKPINQWPNFAAMMQGEVQRFSTLFGQDGKELNPSETKKRIWALIAAENAKSAKKTAGKNE